MPNGFRKDHEQRSTPSASGFYAKQPGPLEITTRMATREREKMCDRMISNLVFYAETV